MATRSAPPSPLQRAAAIDEVLGVWAKAFGCATNQVTEVARKAGLPIEKLWNCVDAASHASGAR
jgi:hypothetical protein